MEKNTDYIITKDNEQFLVETETRDVKKAVIEQYVRCRKYQHMTQEQLALKSGISRPNITRFESGRANPSLEMLIRIADAMDMDIEIRLREKRC